MKAKLMLPLRLYFGSKLMKICSFHPSSVHALISKRQFSLQVSGL